LLLTGVAATVPLAAAAQLRRRWQRGGSTVFTAYFNWLQSHGVNASTGTASLNTADPKVAAAIKTCAPLHPTREPSTAPARNG
jgi:hypothetical protein